MKFRGPKALRDTIAAAALELVLIGGCLGKRFSLPYLRGGGGLFIHGILTAPQ